MVSNCDLFYLVKSGDSCAVIAAAYGIPLTVFYSWNPAVGTSCLFLDVGDYVCVDIIGYTASVTTMRTTSTPTNGITTPTPIQTGMVSNCDDFYLVKPGDSCSAIGVEYDVPLPSFYAWNPAVGSSCSFLDVDDYVCVATVGYVAPTKTTTAGNGVTTPSPYETPMVSDCNKFHFVVSGDSCDTIAAAAGITLAEFESWNSGVGTSCAYLDLDKYVCIGIL